MRIPTRIILSVCSLTFAIRAEAAPNADLPKLIAEAATYQSGQSAEPLQKIEQLLRDSAGKPALKAELETALVKLLAPSATFEARRFACKLLAVVGTDASLPTLAELLKKEETLGIACLALSSRRSPKVNEILRNALPAARGLARIQLISALGNHQDGQAVETLAKLARDADAAVALTAVVALGKIGTAPAHKAIASLRKEARPALAWAVTEATLRVAEQVAAAGDRQAAAAIYTDLVRPASPKNIRRGALAALMAIDADGGQQRILDTLRSRDPVLTPVAIAGVASLKAKAASQTFAAMLGQLSPSAQVWMIEALASRGDDAARRAIRAQLTAGDAQVRRAAVSAVGKLEDASVVPALVKMLAGEGSPEEVRDVEIAIISLRGGAATDGAMVAELKQSSAPTKVRLFTLLARRGARAAMPALLVEAGGSDVATAQGAFRALSKIATADDVPALLEKLVGLKGDDVRADAEHAAGRAMAKIADVSRRSEIVRAMLAKSPDIEARCSLLRLLPSAADASALAALKTAGTDQEPRIRDTAVRALAAWPDATGWDAITAVLRRPESGTHRALALRALVRLAGDLNANPDAALIARYRQLLAETRSDDECKLILGSLAGAAHPDALQLALPLVSRAAVRAEAELAVRKIAASVRAQHPQAAQDALNRLKQAKSKR